MKQKLHAYSLEFKTAKNTRLKDLKEVAYIKLCTVRDTVNRPGLDYFNIKVPFVINAFNIIRLPIEAIEEVVKGWFISYVRSMKTLDEFTKIKKIVIHPSGSIEALYQDEDPIVIDKLIYV